MLRRVVNQGRAAAEAAIPSNVIGIMLKILVCVVGGTLGWVLAQL